MAAAGEAPDGSAPYIFVSYASADQERVAPVVDALRVAGVPVWIDRQGIAGGENYGAEIADAIKGAAAFVLMASAASLASRNVKQEIALGWRYERPYVPLLLEAVTIPDDLAYWLEASQWIEVLDGPQRAWLPRLLEALAPLGIAPAPPAQEAMVLAGRERELALLREKLARAMAGAGGLVLIGGEAGIGKTTLAEALCAEAGQQGCTVLEGHCFDLAETPPYGPWIDLFLRFPALPSGPPLPPAFAERGTVGAVPSQMALFAQVQDFLDALTASRPEGTRPVAMLLDDLHWSDPASLDLLRFLARSVATRPLLILVTYRSDELTRRHPLYALLPQLAREAGAERIDLRRLDDDAVRALVIARYHLPDDVAARLAAYLQTRAEGNALFVGELLRALEEAGTLHATDDGWQLGDLTQTAVPALLRQVIDGRLARLDDESQRLLAVAAVIGHEVPLAVWAAVGEVDDDAVLAVAEEGLEARLLVEIASGESVRFAHALIRETLYEGVPAIRRRRVHRRAGEALAAQRDADPDAVAYHFQQAGDERAIEWLVAAAGRAHRAYAWPTAADRFEAALGLLPESDATAGERGWLLYQIAFLRRYQAREQGVQYLDEAASLATTAGDGVLGAHVRFYRGVTRLIIGEMARGLDMLTAGVDALESLSATDVWPTSAIGLLDPSLARGTLVVWLNAPGRYAEAAAMGERYLARVVPPAVGAPGSTPYLDGLGGMGHVYEAQGRPAEARRMCARAREVAIGLDHHLQVSHYYRLEIDVMLAYETEQVDERRRLADEEERAATRASAVVAGDSQRQRCARLMVVEGDWDGVAEVAREPWGVRYHVNNVKAAYAQVAVARGEAAMAWSLISAQLPDGMGAEPGEAVFDAAVALQRLAAALALDEGELPAAKGWLETHDRWIAWSGAVLGQSEGQALWAQYHRQAGDAEKAREYAERALAHATEPRQPLALLAAHRLLGALDTDAGRHEAAEQHLHASLVLADACQAPYERALTLLAMAELRAAFGDADTAQTLIEEVRGICTPLGAKPALARADALIAKLIAS